MAKEQPKANRGVKHKETQTDRRRLTVDERMKCVAAYLHYGTYQQAAAATGFSIGTIKNCVQTDPDFVSKYQKKREQEAQELFGALSAKSKKFLKFVDAFYDQLSNPQVVARMGIQDLDKLARIYGIMVDKALLLNKAFGGNVGNEDNEIHITVTTRKHRVGEEPDDDIEDDEDE
jgi:hypothetical protein